MSDPSMLLSQDVWTPLQLGQWLPQAPQWLKLFARSTHVPLQHVLPSPQAKPQPPQLLLSV
jgi:hypothetical protein